MLEINSRIHTIIQLVRVFRLCDMLAEMLSKKSAKFNAYSKIGFHKKDCQKSEEYLLE